MVTLCMSIKLFYLNYGGKMSNKVDYDKKLLVAYILRTILQIIALLSIIVLGLYVLLSLSTYFIGFSFFMSTDYGWEAVSSAFLIFGMIFWPLFVICAVIIIGACIYFGLTKGKYNKEDRKKYLKIAGKGAIVPVSILMGIALIIFAGLYYFTSTYSGAKVLVFLGMEMLIPKAGNLNVQIDMEDTRLIEKNGEVIYVEGIMDEHENMDFMDDYYYVQSITGINHNKVPDMVGADLYIFYDDYGIFNGRMWVKDKYVVYSPSSFDEPGSEYCTYYIRLYEN